jgi:hypothetical protein
MHFPEAPPRVSKGGASSISFISIFPVEKITLVMVFIWGIGKFSDSTFAGPTPLHLKAGVAGLEAPARNSGDLPKKCPPLTFRSGFFRSKSALFHRRRMA